MPLLDSIKYPSNFISHIVFKVDYAPILSLTRTPPPELQKKIEKDFPLRDEKITSAWVFLSADKKRKLTVAPMSFTLELFSYDHFKEFEALAQSVYNSFAAIYKPPTLKGLSLRYVNTIAVTQGRPLDWKGMINESLTHVCDHFVWDKREVARCLSHIVFEKDDHLILFNFGVKNPDYPAKITKKEYTLDIECVTTAVTEGAVPQKLKDYHDEIQSLFESCIDADLRAILQKKST
jgi:uncharacterized protein (TIGR04255 family)